MTVQNIRNIAIIAHVDHGKTTLIDALLKQSGNLAKGDHQNCVMDSGDQEKERGITITAKNTAIHWNDYQINIIDTPGHADFGGEVERVLSMVDGVCLLVDAVDGPMPQTRFVTQKAFEQGLSPIVVVNKIDRPAARPDWVIDQVFELFDRLGASDEQLDFPVIYTSALQGISGTEPQQMLSDMQVFFETVVTHTPAPQLDAQGAFQMQISALDYDQYIGVIGIGRIERGVIKQNTPVKILDRDETVRSARVLDILKYNGLERYSVEQASAGDIVCVTGLGTLSISDTLCDPEYLEPRPPLAIDEPSVSITFRVNDSPFSGKEGSHVSSRKIRERLDIESIHNVALHVEEGSTPDRFKVSGRGELHLAVLIESMRREGYEFSISRPEVLQKDIDGQACEPYESVVIDVDHAYQGAIIEEMGARNAQMLNMEVESEQVRLYFKIPSRGLIGFRSQFLSMTAGTGIMNTGFDHYGPVEMKSHRARKNGVLIASTSGQALGYALYNLQERGRLFISPGVQVYEGMVIGIHNRDNDLVVNPIKGKQLTNIRAAGSDENINLTPPITLTIESAMDFINDDELIEITPESIWLRKKHLLESDRKRAKRSDD